MCAMVLKKKKNGLSSDGGGGKRDFRIFLSVFVLQFSFLTPHNSHTHTLKREHKIYTHTFTLTYTSREVIMVMGVCVVIVH